MLSGFSFTNIHDSQDSRGRKGEVISLTTLCHFHPLHRHLDISRTISSKSSPLHIANSRTWTGNIWLQSASRELLSYSPLYIYAPWINFYQHVFWRTSANGFFFVREKGFYTHQIIYHCLGHFAPYIAFTVDLCKF